MSIFAVSYICPSIHLSIHAPTHLPPTHAFLHPSPYPFHLHAMNVEAEPSNIYFLSFTPTLMYPVPHRHIPTPTHPHVKPTCIHTAYDLLTPQIHTCTLHANNHIRPHSKHRPALCNTPLLTCIQGRLPMSSREMSADPGWLSSRLIEPLFAYLSAFTSLFFLIPDTFHLGSWSPLGRGTQPTRHSLYQQ